ncbi:transposase [Dickeya zeae EC1]|nr:transposase [Dickeya zeae EC1]
MYYVGIDISKRVVDVCLLVDGIKGKRKTKTLPNGPNAVEALAEWLTRQQCDPGQAHIVMEATGIYHEHLAYGLHQSGIAVSVINPHRLREFAKGMGILTKTGKVDACALACYGCLRQPECWTPPAPEIRKLRALLQHRDSLLGDKQRLENRLSALSSTLTTEEVMASLELMVQHVKDELEHIERLIADHIDKYPGLKNDLKLLKSIDGVGDQIGWNMLATIRGSNFRSAEQVAAYLGVIPVERRSGTSVRGRARLSKIGPPAIRAKLYMGAIAAISHNHHVKAQYERLLQKGKAKMLAIGAAMRKLVHLCYGVLHTQQQYDRNYGVVAS